MQVIPNWIIGYTAQIFIFALQAYAAEAGTAERAEQPMEAAGMTDEILQKLQDKATLLTAERKKRGKTIPEGLVTTEDIRAYRQQASHTGLHSASVPGILSLDVCLSDTSKIVTGGNDKNVTVFNKDTGQVVAILEGHTKKVTSVLYHPEEVGFFFHWCTFLKNIIYFQFSLTENMSNLV